MRRSKSMLQLTPRLVLASLSVFVLSCSTPTSSVQTSAADMTRFSPRDYDVEVTSDPPGAAIEVNGDYRGRAPCVVKIHGTYDQKMTAHGAVVKAIPSRPGEFVQT